MTDETPKKAPHLRVVSGDPKKPSTRKPAAKGKGTGGGTGGRPPHQPTGPNRALVCVCMAMGYTVEQTAQTLEVSPTTLRLHYAEELANGAAKANAKVATNLFTIAVSPTHPKAVTAAIFWAKARMGWVDKAPEGEEGDDEDTVQFTLSIGDKRGA